MRLRPSYLTIFSDNIYLVMLTTAVILQSNMMGG